MGCSISCTYVYNECKIYEEGGKTSAVKKLSKKYHKISKIKNLSRHPGAEFRKYACVNNAVKTVVSTNPNLKSKEIKKLNLLKTIEYDLMSKVT